MDVLCRGGLQVSPLKDFDRKLEIRTEKHEQLRRRTNVTSCRSPARDDDTVLLKHRLKEKRQTEFLRRRSLLSPLASKSIRGSSSEWFSYSGSSWSLQSSPNTDDWMMMMLMEEASSSMEDITMENITHETIIDATKMRSEAGVQTESGLVTIKESDVLQLQDYLQEALWREETIKKKLAALQESIAQLLNTSNTVWKSRSNEDVLRNKIKVLEAQLQPYVQRFPKDATRKLVLQMKKQKVMFEEKTHKFAQEKNEALSKTGEALNTAKVDVLRLQDLYKELMHTCEKLRQQQDFSTDQLRQQQVQIELSRCREAALTEELVSLRQEKNELQFNIGLLEEYNQFLRDKQRSCSDGNIEEKDGVVQKTPEEEAKPKRDVMVERTPEEEGSKRDSDLLEEQLLYTQKELRLKEKECESLQTELHTMEQEFQSSQTRLSQCREELRQVSHHRNRPVSGILRVSWWSLCVILVLFILFLLLLVVGGATVLWLWHLPSREQMEDLHSDIGRRIEDYFMQMTSPKNPGCFRPF
ncbi:TRAF3-interacting JNK-activating modulator isoform X2 [Dunckerocampus dactyliophorus]|uniref:TRAF3-interacting JNK-activating modulator isoform X2 n=1 Tax=Dunckerocampus dactyliophorus TaxID=161453 RepID=UPI002405F44F|nr:TRAF3-interacting JNK-activating modulator isoform X2 [Dunckerocampus dactyliophorus]